MENQWRENVILSGYDSLQCVLEKKFIVCFKLYKGKDVKAIFRVNSKNPKITNDVRYKLRKIQTN